MRSLRLLSLFVPFLLLGCADGVSRTVAPDVLEVDLKFDRGEHDDEGDDGDDDGDDDEAARKRNFRTALSGNEEVPVRATPASGRARFQLSGDGKSLEYRLRVKDISNVVFAHIHYGVKGANGGVVVFLFGPVAPGGGAVRGELARGTITQANLIGAFAGKPLSTLMSAIRADSAYVNVHTNNGVAGSRLQPGNYPGGEVRGQIAHDHGNEM